MTLTLFRTEFECYAKQDFIEKNDKSWLGYIRVTLSLGTYKA